MEGQINTENTYLFGKGKVAFCERAGDGSISKQIYVGNCPAFSLSGSEDTLQHFESESGLNAQDRRITRSTEMNLSLTLENISNENLATILWGNQVELAQSAGLSHEFPSGIVAGDVHTIPNVINLQNAVLVDDTPTPVNTDHYKIDSRFGSVQFITVSGYTQPFSLNYDRGPAVRIPFLNAEKPYRYVRFEGLNIGNPGMAGQYFLVEVYNVGFSLPSDMSLIGEEFAQFQLEGSIQRDETRAANSNLGGYGNIMKYAGAFVPESSSSS